MTFDLDDIGGIALGVGVSQDIQFQEPTCPTHFYTRSYHLHPKIFSKDLGHGRQSYALGKATELFTKATNLFA